MTEIESRADSLWGKLSKKEEEISSYIKRISSLEADKNELDEKLKLKAEELEEKKSFLLEKDRKIEELEKERRAHIELLKEKDEKLKAVESYMKETLKEKLEISYQDVVGKLVEALVEKKR